MKSSRKLGRRITLLGGALALVAAVAPATATATALTAAPAVGADYGHPAKPAAKPTVVLVHGAWADGSSWSDVVTRLQRDGYTVAVPPNPLRGVASDSAYLANYLKTITGPIVLVGHSYGGFVITNAATGNKNVQALVYVDAYIPAKGDTLNTLTAQYPGSKVAPAALNFVPQSATDIDVYVKPAQFRDILANDLPNWEATELAATQRPLAASALDEPSGTPAWTTIPSWDVIGLADHALPAAAQQFMATRAGSTVTKVNASHLSMLSHPSTVEHVIEDAAHHTS
ncbi:alpha/beta hydrolase [Amycolatopsis rhabdoformis]|uniref:Alpha/beta hydrolase n=1 Tax=Amycolatopsis rhabdoformis TaxID=1448059 RepID=A0ABZ1I7J4_9PSEU|nr:alpha/beta hydrolase [Amycolatopsis rhabdoformis]WSE29946.1 alpha/beta hydrolase [Amycolatopsis rhabdoformis]